VNVGKRYPAERIGKMGIDVLRKLEKRAKARESLELPEVGELKKKEEE
jgi:hypothetical protein